MLARHVSTGRNTRGGQMCKDRGHTECRFPGGLCGGAIPQQVGTAQWHSGICSGDRELIEK